MGICQILSSEGENDGLKKKIILLASLYYQRKDKIGELIQLLKTRYYELVTRKLINYLSNQRLSIF